jgi:hypothetical protein
MALLSHLCYGKSYRLIAVSRGEKQKRRKLILKQKATLQSGLFFHPSSIDPQPETAFTAPPGQPMRD